MRSRDVATPSARASKARTASLASPSLGFARTFTSSTPSPSSIPSDRAPGVTRNASRPSTSASARIASAGGKSALGRATQRRHVPLREAAVALGLEADLGGLVLVLGAQELRRAADPDFARRDLLARAEQRARRQHRAFADPAIVHRHRAHAD